MTPAEPPLIEALAARHIGTEFRSGSVALDRYLSQQATQDARKHIAAPFVMVGADNFVIGYYMFSAASIHLSALPEATARRLPKYPEIPATLPGRLAVDSRRQGRGYGRFLANDEAAQRFYERESFLGLPDTPLKLFRPMADIKRLFL